MIIIKRIGYYIRYIFILFSILCSIMLLIRCNRFASADERQVRKQSKHMDEMTITDHIGSSKGKHTLHLSGIYAQIDVVQDHIIAIRKSFDQASTTQTDDQILLELEEVRGTADANILNVSVNQKEAGHFSLYGLSNASQKEQGEKGLSFTMNITELIKEFHFNDTIDLQTVDVYIYPRRSLSKSQDITIEKINIYRVHKKL